MNKRILIGTICVFVALFAACGVKDNDAYKQTQETIEEITDSDNMENDTVTEKLTEEETSKFASGVADESNPAENKDENVLKPVNDLVVDGSIYEFCPTKATMRQPGITYNKFVHGTYLSATCGMERGYNILLPASYDSGKNYPVLYLLHGIFGDENSMTDSNNKVVEMVSNLSDMGIIEETIVVCPNMFAADNDEIKPGFSAEQCVPYDNFINDLVNDLMPYIEANYSAKTGRDNTMLAGFSMGGRETLYIALKRPELFGYVCAIAPAPGVTPGADNFMSHPGQLSEEEFRFADDAVLPDVFIVMAGTQDSVVGKFPKGYHELFEKNGVDHIWYEVEGADHDNNAIKSGLFNLFMQTAYAKLEK